MTRLTTGLLAAALVSAGVAGLPATASAGSAANAAALTGVHPGEAYSQFYRGRRFVGRGYYGRGYYGRGYRRGYGGGAAAAGIAGLAAGALIGGAIASQNAPATGYGPGAPVGNVYGQDPRAVQYCANRYRSYDPASGTFLANDGVRYACP